MKNPFQRAKSNRTPKNGRKGSTGAFATEEFYKLRKVNLEIPVKLFQL